MSFSNRISFSHTPHTCLNLVFFGSLTFLFVSFGLQLLLLLVLLFRRVNAHTFFYFLIQVIKRYCTVEPHLESQAVHQMFHRSQSYTISHLKHAIFHFLRPALEAVPSATAVCDTHLLTTCSTQPSAPPTPRASRQTAVLSLLMVPFLLEGAPY